MKKGWKVFWIVMAAFAGIGFLMIGIGAALGGSFEFLRSRYPDGLVIGAAGCGRVISEHTVATEEGLAIEDAEHFTADEQRINELDISVSGVAVKILTEERADIEVSAEGVPKNLGLRIYEDEDTLKIETREHVRKQVNGTITIRLPKGKAFEEASLSSNYGTLEANQIEARELNIEAGTGGIQIACFWADELSAECGVGTLELQGIIRRHGEIECGTGNVILTLGGTEEDYSFRVESGIGSVKIGEQRFSGVGASGTLEGGTDAVSVEVENGIGNTEISFDESL